MSYRFKIDYSELKAAVKNFESVKEIDMAKEVNWYINQVYRDLSRKHGKKYSYITPPGVERTNLRVRSRRLLNALSASRFTRTTKNSVTAGWDIPEGNPRGNYLGVHVAENDGEAPYRMTPQKAKYTYTTKTGQKRILIPLRAGMNPDGSPKPIPARIRGQLRGAPFKIIKDRSDFDWSGEQKKKFHANTYVLYKTNGRRKTPMYIIVKKANIPRRLLLGPTMDKHKEAFVERIENQIEKELNRVTSKRNR